MRGTTPLHRVPLCRGRRLGLSLPEVLISLTITALLLTAAAAAFSASADAVQANDEFFRATQAARVSMRHILGKVRVNAVDETWSPTQIRVMHPADAAVDPGDEFAFRYVPETGQLLLVTESILDDRDYVLASNISGMRFSVELGQDYNKAPCVAKVSVEMTVSVGNNLVRLSGSATPRRNLIY